MTLAALRPSEPSVKVPAFPDPCERFRTVQAVERSEKGEGVDGYVEETRIGLPPAVACEGARGGLKGEEDYER